MQVLTHYANSQEDVSSQVSQLLQSIDPNQIPPLQVIQSLSTTDKVPLSMVKGYLLTYLDRELEQAEVDARELEKFRDETKRMRREIRDLETRLIQIKKISFCSPICWIQKESQRDCKIVFV